MASIDDVAAAAGVSTATVSRALRGLPGVSPQTRSRVRQQADSLGYVPSSSASGLASGRTLAMGVLLPVIDSWFFASALEGIDRALRAAGYDLVLFNLGGTPGNRDRVFHRSMLRKRIDALLVLGMMLTEAEQAALKDLDSPTIIVGGHAEGLRHVSIDDTAAVSLAVSYLISLGHTKIAHLDGGGSYGMDFAVPIIRERAYADTMAQHGLAVNVNWNIRGDFSVAGGKRAAEKILDQDELPTAIFASSDEMAFGALIAAAERQLRVPQDLSVIGIDDHEFAEPMGLSTIRQFPEEAGAYAAEILLAELRGQKPVEVPDVQPHELVVRRSTAPPGG